MGPIPFHPRTLKREVWHMRHPQAPSLRLVRRAALAGLAGMVFVSHTAAAQIGDLRRRARAAVTGQTATRPCDSAKVVFDTLVLELTSARLEQVLKGLRAAKALLDGRPGKPGWDALAARRDAAAKEVEDLEQQHGAASDQRDQHSSPRFRHCRGA